MRSISSPPARPPPPASPGPGSLAAAGYNLSAYTFEGDLYVVSGKLRLTFPAKATLVSVTAAVNTAPTGAAAIFDVHKNGVTVFTDQTTRPQIAATALASTAAAPQVTAVGIGEYLTVDIDQKGSTLAGGDLVVAVRWTEST